MFTFPDPPPKRHEFPVLWPITTRWSDNDAYGHVNNVVHYSWFDTAINGWLMHATGTDTRGLNEIGVVAETACSFRSELSFPDDIEVGLALGRLGHSSVTYRLAVFGNRNGDPASLGHFVHVYVDQSTHQPTRVPQIIRTALERLKITTGEAVR